jgi:hypothetical protein
MILSKRHSFVFIKGRKVAGTSVEVFLSAICGSEDIITPITPIDEKFRIESGYRHAQNYGANAEDHNNYISLIKSLPKEDLIHVKHPKSAFYNHMPLTQVLELSGEITSDEWFIFAIDRCPYQKIISMANMELNFDKYKKTGNAMYSDIKSLKLKVSDFFREGKISDVKNIDLYKNHERHVETHILRFENLHEDLARLMVKLNIKAYPELPHLKKGILSKNIDPHDVFEKDQLEAINDIFRQEFDLFGYKMIS